MKKVPVIFLSVIFLASICFPAFADEKLPIDKDVKEGKVKASGEEVEKEALQEDKEELDTTEAPKNESSPSMPEAANKSVYFGDVSLFCTYSLLNMDKFNKSADKNGYQKLNSAVVFGLDLGYKMSEMISVGPRAEFIKASGNGSDTTYTTDAAFIPVMIGFKSNFSLPDLSSMCSIGVYAGYGWLTGKLQERNPSGTDAALSSTLSGSGFAADIDAAYNYIINPTLSAGLKLGYRYASVMGAKLKGDLTITKGSLDMDFGGINFGIGVNMNY